MIAIQVFPVIGWALLSSLTSVAAKPHPSSQVALEYLRAIHVHEWEKAVKLVDPESLKNLQRFQKRYLEAAPTVPDEEALLRLLDLKSVSDIDKLEPAEVFIRRGRAKTSKLVDPEKHIAEMAASLKLTFLGSVPEGDNTVHAIVRKQFEGQGKRFSELAFVSLVKVKDKWMISLDAQEPKIEDIDLEKKN